MCKKFYPTFVGYEDDVRQEMMVSLIKAIRRIRKGEIRSEQNYIITSLKYTTYKIAKKIIEYEDTTVYLNDINLTKSRNNKGTPDLGWEAMLGQQAVIDPMLILSTFELEEEQMMIKHILKVKGYSKSNLKSKLKYTWEQVEELEHNVKTKIVEIIKLYYK